MSLGRRCRRKHPSRGRPKENIPVERPPVEATIENPNISVSQPSNRSRDVMRLPLEPDIVSLDSTNSVREQLRQVNQRIDEVQGGVFDYRLWSPTTGALTQRSTNPSIPHGTSALTVLLIIDREAPVHSARNVTTDEPVRSRRIISGQEARRSQEILR
ncbi:hypothetical protein B296_00056521 [Ensete ventricosum]|uniref:Uncharacterized protein n=1 Tax=Ensete ventricosum TaxID=4639 RepID=A0A426XDH6_ENSVE|nr:hypothetical protein B296_00056521 [Ensete ventricosum]